VKRRTGGLPVDMAQAFWPCEAAIASVRATLGTPSCHGTIEIRYRPAPLRSRAKSTSPNGHLKLKVCSSSDASHEIWPHTAQSAVLRTIRGFERPSRLVEAVVGCFLSFSDRRFSRANGCAQWAGSPPARRSLESTWHLRSLREHDGHHCLGRNVRPTTATTVLRPRALRLLGSGRSRARRSD
jgi:hypothetical protein